jgi:hypothetical protein
MQTLLQSLKELHEQHQEGFLIIVRLPTNQQVHSPTHRAHTGNAVLLASRESLRPHHYQHSSKMLIMINMVSHTKRQ